MIPTSQYILSLVTATAVVLVVAELLRRRQLHEKYAVLWLLVGLAVGSISVFPQLLSFAAGTADVAVPVNLLFFAAIILLLGVTMHLSWESSRAEDRTRQLAEEVALLRLKLESLSHRRSGDSDENTPDSLPTHSL